MNATDLGHSSIELAMVHRLAREYVLRRRNDAADLLAEIKCPAGATTYRISQPAADGWVTVRIQTPSSTVIRRCCNRVAALAFILAKFW